MPFSTHFLKAVTAYLTDINQYAAATDFSGSSDAKSGDGAEQEDNNNNSKVLKLIHYNVGGAVSVVSEIRKLYKEETDPHLLDLEAEQLLLLLKRAWFLESEALPIVPTYKEYFNRYLDPTCTLNYIIAQILVQLKNENTSYDKFAAELFNTSANLLNQYSNFIIYQETNRDLTFLTGDEFKRLESTFERLVKLEIVEKTLRLTKVERLRREGNEVFKQGKFGPAVAKYTQALLLDPKNYMIYSNRAAAFTYLSSHDDAIEDLTKAVELKPDFEVAWTRLGYSYLGRGKPIDSIKAYVKAISLADRDNALPQYMTKLIQSLNYSKERAVNRGSSKADIEKLTESITPILEKYQRPNTVAAAAPQNTAGPQPSGQAQGPAGNTNVIGGNPSVGVTRNQTPNATAEPASDFIQTLNALGNIFTNGATTGLTFVTNDNGDILSSNIISSNPNSARTAAGPTNDDIDSTAGNDDDIDVENIDATTETDSRPPSRALADVIEGLHLPEALRGTIGNLVSEGFQTAMRRYTENNRANTTTTTATNADASNNTEGNSDSRQAPEDLSSFDADLDLD